MCLEQGMHITCSEHYCLTLYSKTPIYLKPRFTADVLFPPKPAVNQGFTVIKLIIFQITTTQLLVMTVEVIRQLKKSSWQIRKQHKLCSTQLCVIVNKIL